jgi:hypothetical protein
MNHTNLIMQLTAIKTLLERRGDSNFPTESIIDLLNRSYNILGNYDASGIVYGQDVQNWINNILVAIAATGSNSALYSSVFELENPAELMNRMVTNISNELYRVETTLTASVVYHTGVSSNNNSSSAIDTEENRDPSPLGADMSLYDDDYSI